MQILKQILGKEKPNLPQKNARFFACDKYICHTGIRSRDVVTGGWRSSLWPPLGSDVIHNEDSAYLPRWVLGWNFTTMFSTRVPTIYPLWHRIYQNFAELWPFFLISPKRQIPLTSFYYFFFFGGGLRSRACCFSSIKCRPKISASNSSIYSADEQVVLAGIVGWTSSYVCTSTPRTKYKELWLRRPRVRARQ